MLVLASCTEDVSRDINTDLTQEADQFFHFSEALSESSFLGNISYTEYFRITSEELPGCPTIVRNTGSRTIELDYSAAQECTQVNKSVRTGKIILDFAQSNTTNLSWTLSYQDYSFENVKLEGTRHFKNTSFNENEETFDNLSIVLDNNLGFSTSGSFNYSVAKLSFRPFALSTRGRIQGTNPAGRDFSLVITESKEQLFSCYRDGWELPQTGMETWVVSRGTTNGLNYMIKFEANEACDPTVISTLPDGRTLQLNP